MFSTVFSVTPAGCHAVSLARQNSKMRSCTDRPSAVRAANFVRSCATLLRLPIRPRVGTNGTAYRAHHSRAEPWYNDIIWPGCRVEHCLVITPQARDRQRSHTQLTHVAKRHRLFLERVAFCLHQDEPPTFSAALRETKGPSFPGRRSLGLLSSMAIIRPLGAAHGGEGTPRVRTGLD